MITILVNDHEIEVEQYFVTLFFDREEVESMIMEHYRDEYSDHIFRVVDEEGASYKTDFIIYNDIERHDVINDLMYYHDLKPTRIKLVENENK
jgi:hypothetical protein